MTKCSTNLDGCDNIFFRDSIAERIQTLSDNGFYFFGIWIQVLQNMFLQSRQDEHLVNEDTGTEILDSRGR